MSLIFAPRASVHLTGQFFPARQSGRRGFFAFGSPLVLIFFFYVYALLAALVFAVWLSLLALIWAAQLVWLVLAGPVVLIRRRTHPAPVPPAPRLRQEAA